MLLNLSNHPSTTWPENQMQAAIEKYGPVEDLLFPQVNPELTSDQMQQLVGEYEAKISTINPTTVHIMGEMTFTHRLVNRLAAIGIPCIASTTERVAVIDDQGNKTSSFKFVQFRDY